ncbi:MAG: hypothetical protein BA066_06425 [Candidatus Korarchaeota archaeon NZ13-K]|nr:MAG: hypothetical protein BA066_06425 [Candidatus Korarchaeota archaeon NZ13-K]
MSPSRSKALALLDLMVKGYLREIAPRYDPATGYDYCAPLRDLGIVPCEEAMKIIGELVEIGVLRREIHDRVASCSRCGSEVLLVRARCPYCGSLRFQSSVVMEHLLCGYVGLEAEFLAQSGRLLCPKCGRELRELGRDFIRVADVQRCEECGEVFSVPSLNYECLKCGYENKWTELRTKEVHRYVVVPGSITVQIPTMRLYEEIRSMLSRDYEVLGPHVVMRGSSGVDLEFDVVLRRPGEGSVAAVVEVADELDEERLMAIFSKAYDVGAGRVVVIHRGEVREPVARLASSLGVRLVRLEGVERTLEEVLRSLGEGA